MFFIPAEDNWRNDYPDEEDLFHSDSEEEGQHSRAAYRYHDSYGMAGAFICWYTIITACDSVPCQSRAYTDTL